MRYVKFGNKPARCSEGVMHQSTLESRRCTELHLMQRGGLIENLRAHPQERYALDVNGVHICNYIPDFVYYDKEQQCEVVEDTKGIQTEVSKLKCRLMLAIHGIEVVIVRHMRKR